MEATCEQAPLLRAITAPLPALQSVAVLKRDNEGFVRKVNQYDFIKELGAGSGGDVSLCKHITAEGKEEFVAVKALSKSKLSKQDRGSAFSSRRSTLTPARSRGAKQRLLSGRQDGMEKVRREIAILRKICHPHITRLIDVIDDPTENTIFVAMEYVGGNTVMVWDTTKELYYSLATGSALEPETAARYISDVLSGLTFLHLQKIVHRDLKPENLLLTLQGRLKITDFGLSHHFETEVCQYSNTLFLVLTQHLQQFSLHHMCVLSVIAHVRMFNSAAVTDGCYIE
jgi:serine/threonine protein kinase